MTETYHIYLDGRCLFKDLDQEEFDVVWGRLYHSYWGKALEYTSVETNPKELIDSSY